MRIVRGQKLSIAGYDPCTGIAVNRSAPFQRSTRICHLGADQSGRPVAVDFARVHNIQVVIGRQFPGLFRCQAHKIRYRRVFTAAADIYVYGISGDDNASRFRIRIKYFPFRDIFTVLILPVDNEPVSFQPADRVVRGRAGIVTQLQRLRSLAENDHDFPISGKPGACFCLGDDRVIGNRIGKLLFADNHDKAPAFNDAHRLLIGHSYNIRNRHSQNKKGSDSAQRKKKQYQRNPYPVLLFSVFLLSRLFDGFFLSVPAVSSGPARLSPYSLRFPCSGTARICLFTGRS